MNQFKNQIIDSKLKVFFVLKFVYFLSVRSIIKEFIRTISNSMSKRIKNNQLQMIRTQYNGFRLNYILINFLATRHQSNNSQIKFMTHFQQKEENYAKWQISIWNSVEKEISLFNKKVTDCMLQLGDINKKNEKDFQVEPCLDEDVILGQDFYIELIRPVCVAKGYLPKKPPTAEDVEDIHFKEEQQKLAKYGEKQVVEKGVKEKAVKAQKKGGKKGGKNPNNEEQMKLKIVKDNFQKDIELVMKSHSMERMQVEFGLKHKKLEVKLMTFFYVAYYIRKNKVNQKIDDSEVFELINILIKIVRIFSHFRGKSFIDNSKQVEVSPTLILDLKYCIKGLKEYYKYDNKVVMIKYPKLVYYTNYDKFFPTLDIKPYDSQIRFIQAVKSALNQKGSIANPTLILYKTMIGSGKTSASIALSELVNQCKLVDQKNSKMQVLYSCLIGSVRVQVGRYAYNKKQKFALAAMQRSIKEDRYYYPRVINSWSCRNEKNVDLIISDLHCTNEMLDHHYYNEEELEIMDHQRKHRKQAVNLGILDRENIILFIDQPTAFCKDVDSKATRKLFDILANYPPKLTILASATMPGQAELPNTIELIRRKNPELQVFEILSMDFQIGCQYCSFKGEIIFPHTGVQSKQELQIIRELLKRNPFLMRLYTGPSLFHLLKKCNQVGLKGLPDVNKQPEIRQNDIIRATERILEILSHQSDDLIEHVCQLSREEDNIDYKDESKENQSENEFEFMEKQESEEDQEVQRADYVDFNKIFKEDAYKFLGGCLIGTADPIKFAQQVFSKWVRSIKPIKRLIQKYEKQVEALTKEIRLLEDDKEMREEKKTQLISKIQSEKEPVLDFPEKKKINTVEHYTRYCKAKEGTHQSMLIKPIPLENVGKDLIEQVDDFILKLLFCGVAIYSQTGLSAKYLDKVEELASQNFLAFIITDESLCYGANFPISNVILRDSLVVKLNMNEMFQLIGRAGRVGQSWTARAFLGAKGLDKLNNYIHKPECQVSHEGEVFEKIAEEHLNYPLLRLRTTLSEIRYLDNIENSENIQILIKKKNIEDSHLFKNISLVPFVKNGGMPKVLSEKLPFQRVTKFNFPTLSISYDDIPKIMNKNEEEIIDVASYYANQQSYISKILDNVIARIIDEKLNGLIKLDDNNFKQLNFFKPKVYEEFFNKATNTFVVLIECKQEFEFKDFKFNTLSPQQSQTDDLMEERLKSLIHESVKLTPDIIEHPSSIAENDVKRIITLHNELISFDKFGFYKEFYNHFFPEEKQHYNDIIEKVPDKEILEFQKQSATILTVNRMRDIINHTNRLFHIDQNVRDIWETVEKKL